MAMSDRNVERVRAQRHLVKSLPQSIKRLDQIFRGSKYARVDKDKYCHLPSMAFAGAPVAQLQQSLAFLRAYLKSDFQRYT